MASLFLCTAPKTLDALFSLLSSRLVNQPSRKFKPFSASILSIIPPQPRRNCTNGVVAAVSTSTSEGQLLRSPQLVALEYADLNLSNNFSEVHIYIGMCPFFFYNSVFCAPRLISHHSLTLSNKKREQRLAQSSL